MNRACARNASRAFSYECCLPGGAGIGLRGIGFLERLSFVHVAIRYAHKTSRPLIFIASMNRGEGILNIVCIQSDERILAHLSPMHGFGLDLFNRALRVLLR